MKLWRFDNAWDYHSLGGFLTVADTPEQAATQVNEFIKSRPTTAAAEREWNRAHSSSGWWPENKFLDYTAEDAEDVGLVFAQDGCDD